MKADSEVLAVLMVLVSMVFLLGFLVGWSRSQRGGVLVVPCQEVGCAE